MPRPTPPQEFGMNPRPERKQVAAAGGGNQPTLEETLRREVEEFLRRSQGQPAQQTKNQPQRSQRPAKERPASLPARSAPQAEPRSKPPEQPRLRTSSPRPEPIKTLAAPLSEQVGRTITGAPLGTDIVQYVTEQMRGTQQLVQHAQSLGSDVAQADERMQQHLEQRFVHQIGTLAPVTAKADQRTEATTAAQELRSLLSRPGGMRQLIVASEILRRPEERWDR
jgi:hypothetical protein